MVEGKVEIPKKADEGKLNHGGWVRIEGKQLAEYGTQGGSRITKSSRRRFCFIDLKTEEIHWLKAKLEGAVKSGWRWTDASIPSGAWDKANEEGRYLCLKGMGKRWNPSLLIQFGKGGKGWSSLAKLLAEASSPLPQAAAVPKVEKGETQQMWEEEVVIVARNH